MLVELHWLTASFKKFGTQVTRSRNIAQQTNQQSRRVPVSHHIARPDVKVGRAECHLAALGERLYN